MEGLIVLFLLIVITAIILYPLWKRYFNCGGSCGGSTLSTPGNCFPSTTFPVKSGLIDLRNCTDHVYIMGDRSRVHFITVSA